MRPRPTWLAACALAWTAIAAGGVPVQPPPANLADLLAVAVEYRAHKLIFTMTTRARLTLAPTDSVRSSVRVPPIGTPVPLPTGRVANLTVETDLPFGRRDVTRILLDPRTGAAVQTERLTTAGGGVRTITRYLTDGVYSWRWCPTSRSEARLGPDSWSAVRERFTRFPFAIPDGAVVTDGYAILPLAEAARLDRPGATLRLYVPSSQDFLTLDFEPQGLAMREMSIEEQLPGTVRVEDGPQLVRVVHVSARALPGGDRDTSHDLGVLGFEGGVTLFVDARTGVPLLLRGRAAYIGTITARLVRVRFAYDPAIGPPAPSETRSR